MDDPNQIEARKGTRHLLPFGFPQLYIKNGRDVAASSHFLYLLRQADERDPELLEICTSVVK